MTTAKHQPARFRPSRSARFIRADRRETVSRRAGDEVDLSPPRRRVRGDDRHRQGAARKARKCGRNRAAEDAARKAGRRRHATNGCSAWTAATRSRPCSSRKRAAARCACPRRSVAGSNCQFCSTGTQGFNRNLSAAEIIGQVFVAAKHLGNVPHQQRKLTNVVMMGMGEPLLNFDNVVRAMSVMRDDLGFGLANKRVTLSTAGLVPMIDKLVGSERRFAGGVAARAERRAAHRTRAAQQEISDRRTARGVRALRRAPPAHVDHVRIHDDRRASTTSPSMRAS